MKQINPSSNLVKVQKTDNLAHAIRLMKDNKIHHLVVFDGEKVEGVVSDKDLLNGWLNLKKDPNEIHIADFFESYIFEISENSTLEEAIVSLNKNATTSALVRCANGEFNIITSFDLLELLGQENDTGPLELAQLQLANPIVQKIMTTLSDMGI